MTSAGVSTGGNTIGVLLDDELLDELDEELAADDDELAEDEELAAEDENEDDEAPDSVCVLNPSTFASGTGV